MQIYNINDNKRGTKMNNEENLQGTLMTANDVANLLHANYRTVRKILEEKRITGELKEGTLTRANRQTIAYYINNSTIKSLNATLKDIKTHKRTFADTKQNTNVTNSNNNGSIAPNNTPTNAIEFEQANVKIYEVMKKNNELENTVNKLESELKDKEIERVKIESDLYKAQADIKLIEDKQKTFEGENSRLTQELKLKEKSINQRNITIIVLSAFLLIILTVLTTIMLMR